MDEFTQDMLDLTGNQQVTEAVRERAALALRQWRDGIIPSAKTLEFFKEAMAPIPDCSRIEKDGSCMWLRKRGANYGLSVPPKGQRALCVFPTAFSKCPGYRKERT